jgi:hypothetical protein
VGGQELPIPWRHVRLRIKEKNVNKRTLELQRPHYGGVDGAELEAQVGQQLSGSALQQVRDLLRQSPNAQLDPEAPIIVGLTPDHNFLLTQEG